MKTNQEASNRTLPDRFTQAAVIVREMHAAHPDFDLVAEDGTLPEWQQLEAAIDPTDWTAEYQRLYHAIKAADDPQAREQLLRKLDAAIGSLRARDEDCLHAWYLAEAV